MTTVASPDDEFLRVLEEDGKRVHQSVRMPPAAHGAGAALIEVQGLRKTGSKLNTGHPPASECKFSPDERPGNRSIVMRATERRGVCRFAGFQPKQKNGDGVGVHVTNLTRRVVRCHHAPREVRWPANQGCMVSSAMGVAGHMAIRVPPVSRCPREDMDMDVRISWPASGPSCTHTVKSVVENCCPRRCCTSATPSMRLDRSSRVNAAQLPPGGLESQGCFAPRKMSRKAYHPSPLATS